MVIADTGLFLALANRSDRHHERAKRALRTLGSERLMTTWPVLTEACHLFVTASDRRRIVESVNSGAVTVLELSMVHVPRMMDLMEKYADLPMDLADASLVLLAETLNDGRILSTDERDFHTYRWKNRKPFKNLLATA